ncbi:hypothetical protein CsSME_00015761 [Camellia sinensis var. sinensis]
MSRTDRPNPSSELRWAESIQKFLNGPAHLYSSFTKGRAETQRAEPRHKGAELREPLREMWKL